MGAGYTYLDATYQSAETVSGGGNSSNDLALAGVKGLGGNIEIKPGDRIPLIPRHMGKLFADYQATKAFSVDLDALALSSSYARGNENNLHQPDGVMYLGAGKSPGYMVFNTGAHYKIKSRIELVVQINNLFDTRYYTAAQLGPTGFTSTGNFIAREFPAVGGEFPVRQATFYAPGAPRTFWVGTHLKF
jgi:outer membrane receptor protein involved in Fe transport